MEDEIEYMEYESEEEYSGGSAGSPSASSSEDEDWETKDPADWTKLDVNNAYHISKDREDEEGPETAIAGFEKVLVMEQKVFGKHKKWSFKALKRLVRLESSVGNEEKSIRYFKDLLTYNKNDNGITEAELLKGISSVLDAASAGTSVGFALHEIALSALRALKNETLWFKTSLRFAQKLFDLGNHTAVQKVLKEARATCLLEDGSDNPRKGGQLLEIYGIRIQALMMLNKTKKVAAMYGKADRLAAANPGTLDNRMAIFHFVGAQLKLEAQQWEKAYAAFFEALSHLQEGSSNQRIPCMRYFLLSSMLGQSQVKQTIDPFASPEIRHMKNLPGVAPMADLVAAFQRHDLQDFERVLNKNRSALMEDPIVAKYLPLVHREMRCRVLTESVKAYSCIGLPFVATKLGVRMDELYDLLVFLIQEGRIKGQLDCVKQQLILDTSATGGAQRVPYQALDKWVNQLGALHTILGRVV